MPKVMNKSGKRNRDEQGIALLDFALLAALIAVVAIPSVSYFGAEVENEYWDIGRGLENPASANR